MAKYIVDMDALLKSCELLTVGRVNGKPYAYTENVKALIQIFPKDEVKETITFEAKSKVTSEADGETLTACKEYLNEE